MNQLISEKSGALEGDIDCDAMAIQMLYKCYTNAIPM